MFVVCLNGRVILPQPASCFASIGERAKWLRLAFFRAQWLRLAFFRITHYNSTTLQLDHITCKLLRTQFNLTCVIQHDKCLIELYVDQREHNGFCENKTVTNDELTNLSIKTLNTHNLSPYLDKISKIKANSGQRVDDPLDHITTGSHDLNMRSHHL